MRATGTPSWIVAITVSTAPWIESNEQTAADTASGSGCSRTRHLGDHAERSFGPDEQARQIVAGGRLARARAGLNRPGHPRARPSGRARSRASCRSARRSCPTRASRPCRRASRRRRDRSGTSGPCSRSALFSCRRVTPASTVASRSSTLTRRIAVHLAQVDRDAAAHRVHVPFERRARAERHDRHAASLGDLHDRRHLVGRLRDSRRCRARPARDTTRRGCDAREPPAHRSRARRAAA